MASISDADLAGAAHVAGVTLTPEERALMLDGIEAQVDLLRARRASAMSNAVPMASRFDPRPNGWSGRPQSDVQVYAARVVAPLPERDDDIAFATVAQQAGWLRAGALTSRRLTEIYLARIAAIAPRLECFVTVTADRARAEADAADAELAAGRWRGPLHGVPYAAKDLLDTAGDRTTWGALPYRERVADRDAHVVARLRDAGAVLIGKATLGALAYGDVWFGGRTRNPWNPEEGSSGSSAGSAAAVAAGLCGFAIGSETMGSITSPSERCGATGLRPTFGRVGRSGAMTLCWSLDKLGPMGRSVEDCAMVLAAINGPDSADRGAIPTPFEYDAGHSIGGMRVGHLPGTLPERVEEALRSLPVELVEVALPDLPYAALMPVLFSEAAAAFEDLTLGGLDDLLVRQDAEAWPNLFRRARFVSSVDHVQADRLRYFAMQALDALFRQVDAMAGPFGGDMLIATNFTGHPCLHLRAGFVDSATRPGDGHAPRTGDGPRFRVPYGVSLWSGLFDEGRLFNLGAALEAALGVSAERPLLR